MMYSWTQHANDSYDSDCIGERFRSHPSSSSASGTRRARHRTDCNGEGRGGIGRTRRQPAVADDSNFKFLETTVRNNALLHADTQNRAELSESGNNQLFHHPESSTRVKHGSDSGNNQLFHHPESSTWVKHGSGSGNNQLFHHPESSTWVKHGSGSGNNQLFHNPESRTGVRFWKQLAFSVTDNSIFLKLAPETSPRFMFHVF
jgi:hypothetical protein